MPSIEQFCLVSLVSILAIAHAQDLRTSEATGNLTGVSVERLIDYLRQPDRDKIADAMVVKLIDRFGLASRPTSDDMSRIRSAGAPEKLIEAIESARVPELQNAALSITCAPVDCDVSINDEVVGRTQGGSFPWVSIPPGKVRIAAMSPQHEPSQHRVEVLLASGERRRVQFVFKPLRNYRNQVGTGLFKKMLDAVGDTKPNKASMIRAAGNLYIRDAMGEIDGWSVIAFITDEGLQRVEALRMNERHMVVRAQDGRWKDEGPRRAPHLLEAITLLDDALLTRRIESLTTAVTTMTACADEALLSCFLTSGTKGGSSVILDALSRPSEIQEHDSGDKAPLVTYMYADYSRAAGIVWPHVIQAIRGSTHNGIEVRFSNVQLTSAQTQPAGARR